MTHRTPTVRMLSAAAGLAWSAGTLLGAAPPRGEIAPVPMVLIDDQLRARPIGLLRLTSREQGAGELIFIEGRPTGADGAVWNGPRASLPMGRVIAIAPPGWIVEPLDSGPRPQAKPGAPASPPPQPATAAPRPAPAPPPTFTPWVELVDGQRFPGAPMSRPTSDADSRGPAGESLLWAHSKLGPQSFPLDSLRRVVLLPPLGAAVSRAPVPAASIGASDIVWLANGDRVTGFIESLGTSVRVSPEAGAAGSIITLPLEQVSEMRLANPARPLHGNAMWLQDGSLLAAPGLEIDVGTRRVTITPAPMLDSGNSASVDLGELRAVLLGAQRAMPLSALPIAAQQAAPGRRLLEPVMLSPMSLALGSDLGADDLILPGPMTADWALPEQASRLGGWLVLEERSWAWGDCLVTVSIVPDAPITDPEPSGRRVLLKTRLNAANPVVDLNSELGRLPARARLRVNIDPGENGPIQDRVVIRHGLIRVDGAGE